MLNESFIIAACAWVATAVLFQPDMILEWYWNALKAWQGRLPRKYKWVAKPLGLCGFCFSGQIGLWYYFFMHPFDLIQNLIFALLTVFFWSVFNGVDNIYKKHG